MGTAVTGTTKQSPEGKDHNRHKQAQDGSLQIKGGTPIIDRAVQKEIGPSRQVRSPWLQTGAPSHQQIFLKAGSHHDAGENVTSLRQLGRSDSLTPLRSFCFSLSFLL